MGLAYCMIIRNFCIFILYGEDGKQEMTEKSYQVVNQTLALVIRWRFLARRRL